MVDRTGSSPLKAVARAMSSPLQVSRMSNFVSRPRYRRRPRSRSPRNNTTSTIAASIGYPRFEKCAMLMLFVIAWGWILVTLAMLAWYHQGIPGFPSHLRSRLPVSPDTVIAGGIEKEPQQKYIPQPRPDSPFLSETDLETHLEPFTSPVLVFTCKRPKYLQKTLQDIYDYRDTGYRMGCPLIVSQDGNDKDEIQVIEAFQKKFAKVGIPLIHLRHEVPHLRKANAYELLAVHYGWALGKVFGDDLEFSMQDGSRKRLKANRVIILEEDLDISVDFFKYFAAMAPLLDHDSSLLAVSAFNDNGIKGRVSDPTRVLRSDFFPGLGWMMTRRLWKEELGAKWPAGYWDDWLRLPEQRHGRHIIRPEVSRTFHFGSKGGASQNQFGDELSQVHLNDQPVDWTQQDVVSSLPMDRFDRAYWLLLHSARQVNSIVEAEDHIRDGNVRLEYRSLQEFARYANQLTLMPDEKAGIPRTSYKGVVETRLDGTHFLFLTPPMEELQKSFVHAI